MLLTTSKPRWADDVEGDVMQEFEFTREDGALAAEDAWRRLFGRIDPEIRKDMLGWLSLSGTWADASAPANSGFSELFADAMTGASLALDQCPSRPYAFERVDGAAIASDIGAITSDFRLVFEALQAAIEREQRLKLERSVDAQATATASK